MMRSAEGRVSNHEGPMGTDPADIEARIVTGRDELVPSSPHRGEPVVPHGVVGERRSSVESEVGSCGHGGHPDERVIDRRRGYGEGRVFVAKRKKIALVEPEPDDRKFSIQVFVFINKFKASGAGEGTRTPMACADGT